LTQSSNRSSSTSKSSAATETSSPRARPQAGYPRSNAGRAGPERFRPGAGGAGGRARAAKPGTLADKELALRRRRVAFALPQEGGGTARRAAKRRDLADGRTSVLIFARNNKLDSENIELISDARPKKVDIDKMHTYRDEIRDHNEQCVVSLAAILNMVGRAPRRVRAARERPLSAAHRGLTAREHGLSAGVEVVRPGGLARRLEARRAPSAGNARGSGDPFKKKRWVDAWSEHPATRAGSRA
jgi:hypothetical protein